MVFLIRLGEIYYFKFNSFFIWVINQKIRRFDIPMNYIWVVNCEYCIDNLSSDWNSMMVLNSLTEIMNIILQRLVISFHVDLINYSFTVSLNKIFNQIFFIANFFNSLHLSFHSLVVFCLSLNVLIFPLFFQLLKDYRFYKYLSFLLMNLQVSILNSKVASLYYFLFLLLILFF